MRTLANWTVIGYLLLGAMVIWDLSHSNRPHELKMVSPVLVLLAISLAIAIKLAFELKKYWRMRRSVSWRLPRLMMVAATAIYVSVIVFFSVVMTWDYLV